MMTASDENLMRAFQQMHDAVKESVSDKKPYVYGLGISFVTFVLTATKQLADEGRLTADGELAHKAAITNSLLHVSQPGIDANKDGSDPIKATLRHLRNCVAHGNWSYNPADQTPLGDIYIELFDFNEKGAQRFQAKIPFPDLINLAERIMVDTFNDLAKPPLASASSC